MNIKLAAATIGSLMIIAGTPALASAANPQSAPIQIQRFDTTNRQLPDGDNNYNPGMSYVAFTNRSASPATDVKFALSTQTGAITHFNDVGTFAPGVTINHRIPQGPVDEFERITVEQVAFADATVWNNTEVAPEPQELWPSGVSATASF